MFTAPGPNPWKVVLILEELNLPYEINSFTWGEHKKKPFTDLNPNGRVPGASVFFTLRWRSYYLYKPERASTDHLTIFKRLSIQILK